MQAYLKEERYVIYGVSCVGLTIGFSVGISSSPVVTAAVPLLFALVTFALSVYGGEKSERAATSKERVHRSIVGKNLVFLSAAYLVGIWLGVFSKVNADYVWPYLGNSPEFAYKIYKGNSQGVLYTLRAIDMAMANDNISLKEREEIIRRLSEGIEKEFSKEQENNSYNFNPWWQWLERSGVDTKSASGLYSSTGPVAVTAGD